jgi:hypothetical protein
MSITAVEFQKKALAFAKKQNSDAELKAEIEAYQFLENAKKAAENGKFKYSQGGISNAAASLIPRLFHRPEGFHNTYDATCGKTFTLDWEVRPPPKVFGVYQGPN